MYLLRSSAVPLNDHTLSGDTLENALKPRKQAKRRTLLTESAGGVAPARSGE